MMKNILAFFIITLFFFCGQSQRYIDTFNVLLPQINSQKSSRPIQLITASGGCFQWNSNAPQLNVKGLTSEKSNCFKRGLIQLNHVGKYSSQIYVQATNSQTRQIQKISVRIRPIHRIQIIAKSRMMNHDEKQDLSVFAYDKDKNMFTSLQGLKFKWQIVSKQNILTKVSIQNSHLILPLDERKNIQKKGFETDIIVVKGLNPGKSNVKVKCIEQGYQNLSHQITISVHQKFQIQPRLPTYLLIGSKFDFKLINPIQQQIILPKQYYKMTVENQFNVSNKLQIVAPFFQSQTQLKVQDTRTTPSYQSSVIVYSKNPNKILLQTQQYLIVGQNSNVKVKLFWQQNQLKGNNGKISITSTLYYDHLTNNISYNQKKVGIIKATYQQLSVEKKIHVILPLKVILPTDQIILPIQQTFELKIIGGSGFYVYKIQNDQVALINGNGLIISKRQGKSIITVIDQKANHNKISISLIVTPLNTLIPLQNQKQLNINQFGSIYTVGRTKDNKYFTKCSSQEISLQISHLAQFQLNSKNQFRHSLKYLKNLMQKNFQINGYISERSLLKMNVSQFLNKFNLYVNSNDIQLNQLKQYVQNLQSYGICSSLSLKSYQKYDSTMDVFYRNKQTIKNKFNLRVYERIKNNIKGKLNQNHFIMTPLASLKWQTKGGSYKWDNNTIKIMNETLINTTYPIVNCSDDQNNFIYYLSYRNPQSKNLILPVTQTIKINIQCQYPSTLKIKYQKYSFDQQLVRGLKGQSIKGQLIPFTSKRQQFYNSSTLIYQFEKFHGKLKISNDKFQYQPQIMQNFTKIIFWTESIKGMTIKFHRVEAFFQYQTKNMFSILNYTKFLLILFNHKKLYILSLQDISLNGQVSCNGSVLCFYKSNNNTKRIQVNTTKLGRGLIQVKDKNIYGTPSIQITLQVVDADQIIVKTQQTSIQIHNQTIAQVQLFYRNRLIPQWQYDINNFILVHEAGIRSIPISQKTNKFIIKADKSGTYHIQAQQHYPRYLQSTFSVIFTVYSKISINIQNLEQTYRNNVLYKKGQIVIPVNCFRFINIFGGPQYIDVTTEITDQVIKLEKFNDNIRQFRIQGLEKGKTKLKIVVISLNDKSKLSIIQLTVQVKKIQKAFIYTLDQALINAQFRVIAHLLVDGKILFESICDLEYQWKTSQHLNIKSFKNRAGVNATAIKEGQGYIQLKVINKQGKYILTTKKDFTVHKSLDLDLPTIIGENNKRYASTNLLLPPNSGYSFDQNILITKISECQDSALVVEKHKLITSRQKFTIPVKLIKVNDQTYSNFLNVIITQIRALFIQNQHNRISIQMGMIKKLKFYIQDMYGRLFYNNLENIEFDLISSNQQIFKAFIDPNKEYINIQPKKQGEGSLILKLKLNNSQNSLTKLLEIPHDIVNIQVGKVLDPQSPIQLVVGGHVNIQYYGKNKQKWEILSGKDYIEIDEQTKVIKGVKLGSAMILIGGYNVVVNVIDVKLQIRWIDRVKPGFNKVRIQFLLHSKQDDKLISSISNAYNFINNQMHLQCETIRKTWFKSKSSIEKSINGYDKLICQFQKNCEFDLKDEIPIKFQFNVIKYTNGRKIILQNYIQNAIQPTFWISQKFKTIILSYDQPMINIPIKSLVPLNTSIDGGQKQWLKNWASDFNQIQLLHVQLDPRGFNQNFDFTIHFKCQQSGQQENIFVKFIMDQKNRKKIQIQNKNRKGLEEQIQTDRNKQKSQNSKQGWLQGLQWTDFLIIIMSINLIGLIIYYSMCSKNKQVFQHID